MVLMVMVPQARTLSGFSKLLIDIVNVRAEREDEVENSMR